MFGKKTGACGSWGRVVPCFAVVFLLIEAKKLPLHPRLDLKGSNSFVRAYPKLLAVLMTFTPLKRVVGQPCETALDCPGWPFPSLNVPPSR